MVGAISYITGFNPTLVRLRPEQRMNPGVLAFQFQSHAGSIEARIHPLFIVGALISFNPTLVRLRRVRGLIAFFLMGRFNPTLVRLRPIPPTAGDAGGDHVSIPRWFD